MFICGAMRPNPLPTLKPAARNRNPPCVQRHRPQPVGGDAHGPFLAANVAKEWLHCSRFHPNAPRMRDRLCRDAPKVQPLVSLVTIPDRPPVLVVVLARGGRLLGSGTRLPPPPPCPPGPLSCQGSTATGHTYGGAEGARKFFFHSPCPFCPLCTPTLSLNPTLTLMPTPTLSLLLTLPTNLTP